MAAPVLDGEHACRGAGDKHRFSIQCERTGAIFRNVGKWCDSDFLGFSVLDQGSVQSVENSCKSLRQVRPRCRKRCLIYLEKANMIVVSG